MGSVIAPKEPWVKFETDEEKLKYMLQHDLVSQGASFPRKLIYKGTCTDKPTPCHLVGYSDQVTAIVEIDNQLHCIHPDYLATMQVGYVNIVEPETYVVLDVETTGKNHYRDEIIEIGAVKYIRGVAADSFSSFVKPKGNIPSEITDLTGITESDVENAPLIFDIIPKLQEFLGAAPIVAHNATFDISFLRDAYKLCGLPFKNESIDTLRLARKAFPELPNHKLTTLKEFLHIEGVSHRAFADVLTTAEVYKKCNERLRELRAETSESGGECAVDTPNESAKKKFQNNPDPSSLHPTVRYIDTQNPLYGKNIVFTGELSIERVQAFQIAVNAGAVIKSSVSRKTDFLVVGTQDPHLVGSDGLSSKQETAIKLNGEGNAHIEILSEGRFLALANLKG